MSKDPLTLSDIWLLGEEKRVRSTGFYKLVEEGSQTSTYVSLGMTIDWKNHQFERVEMVIESPGRD